MDSENTFATSLFSSEVLPGLGRKDGTLSNMDFGTVPSLSLLFHSFHRSADTVVCIPSLINLSEQRERQYNQLCSRLLLISQTTDCFHEYMGPLVQGKERWYLYRGPPQT